MLNIIINILHIAAIKKKIVRQILEGFALLNRQQLQQQQLQ
jgi:hypothetical protein